MRFWFYSYGANPGTLQIGHRTGTNGPDMIMAEVQGPIGNYWERYEMALTSPYDFQVIARKSKKRKRKWGIFSTFEKEVQSYIGKKKCFRFSFQRTI